jgi:hypothetical protein
MYNPTAYSILVLYLGKKEQHCTFIRDGIEKTKPLSYLDGIFSEGYVNILVDPLGMSYKDDLLKSIKYLKIRGEDCHRSNNDYNKIITRFLENSSREKTSKLSSIKEISFSYYFIDDEMMKLIMKIQRTMSVNFFNCIIHDIKIFPTTEGIVIDLEKMNGALKRWSCLSNLLITISSMSISIYSNHCRGIIQIFKRSDMNTTMPILFRNYTKNTSLFPKNIKIRKIVKKIVKKKFFV